jgi:predicted ATPase
MPTLTGTRWCVITGSPSSGKTSLCWNLAFHGFRICPESARLLIDRSISRGMGLAEIRKDNLAFQRSVLTLHSEVEARLSVDEKCFLDRAVLDCVGYGLPEKEVFLFYKYKYCRVFFLEPIGFKADYARIEDEKEALRLGARISSAYEQQGYDVVRVPVMSIEERTQYILDRS